MSQASKRLKISCFFAIAAGVAALIVGIVSLAGNVALFSAFLLAIGVTGTAVGLWAARAANVPSHAPVVTRVSLVALVTGVIVDIVCLAVANAAPPLPEAICGHVPLVALLAILVCARIVSREQDRR